jgi:hypothetical protein
MGSTPIRGIWRKDGRVRGKAGGGKNMLNAKATI